MASDPWWKTFSKGVAMGLCDVVPGVSGGTIAFITGIYERLMEAIANTFALPRALLTWTRNKKQGPLKEALKRADLGFLAAVFGGVLTAIIIGSRGILYLMEHHFTYTISFFVGLIAASALSITKHLKEKSTANTATLIIGIALGVSFLLYAPASITPSIPYLFMSGFLAVAALFLPGISGSFILLLLGVYEYVLGLVHDALKVPLRVLTFILGALLGAYLISKAIRWLFKWDEPKTLHGLLGLVIGSLSIPIQRLITAGIPNGWLAALFIMAGFVVVVLIERLAR